jgi:hypothetical protein
VLHSLELGFSPSHTGLTAGNEVESTERASIVIGSRRAFWRLAQISGGTLADRA